MPTEEEQTAWMQEEIKRREAMLEEEQEPGPEIIEGTEFDKDLIDAKYWIKERTIQIIKDDPDISREDLKAQIASEKGDWYGDYSDVLLSAYIHEAYQKGYIAEPTYEALRQHIADTPYEELMEER
jgi:hypothetical protein